MLSDDVTELQDKTFLVPLALQQVDAARCGELVKEVRGELLVFLLYFVKRWTYNVFRVVAVAEKFDGFVHLALHVTEADNLAETLFLVQYTVGTAERLKQSVILHVLVNIECVELLAVKAS